MIIVKYIYILITSSSSTIFTPLPAFATERRAFSVGVGNCSAQPNVPRAREATKIQAADGRMEMQPYRRALKLLGG